MKSTYKQPFKATFAAMLMLLLVGFIDFFIPTNIQVLLLYLLPLAYISLSAPMRYCVFVCFWAAICWGISSYLASEPTMNHSVWLWNMLSRFILFFTLVSLNHYYKAQLLEKELAMDALRRSRLEANPIMGLRLVCRECDKVKSSTDEWVPIKIWLARDCKVTWADSCCTECTQSKTGTNQ